MVVTSCLIEFLDEVHHAADLGVTVGEIEQAHLPAVLVVHLHDLWPGLPHLGKDRLVLYDLDRAVVAEEFPAAERQDLHLRVRRYLLRDGLYLASLYVEPAVVEQSRSERAHPRLVTVHSREVVGVDLLQKLVYLFDSFHEFSS